MFANIKDAKIVRNVKTVFLVKIYATVDNRVYVKIVLKMVARIVSDVDIAKSVLTVV